MGLALLAVALTGPGPRVMARLKGFRREPRQALLVWQAVSLAGVVAGLAVAPAGIAVSGLPGWATVLALVFSAALTARLLWSGHRVGTRLRARRRGHRALVDALGTHTDGTLRVLAHPTPTAYCLPGLRQRVVLTEGALLALPPEELEAVMAHERAHLRERHDLVLEFFTVLHESVPARMRAPQALREVRLLVEVLADRAARRVAGPVAVARALVTLASSTHPDAALAAGDDATIRDRMLLLAADPAPRWLAPCMGSFAAAVLVAPVALLVVAVG